MGENYVIENGFAFLQQVHHLMNSGYTNYFIGFYPEVKRKKFNQIDKKIVELYNCNFNKDKIYYRKKKGLCNAKFLRKDNMYVLLKTNGKEDIDYENEYVSVFEKPFVFEISKDLSVEIHKNSKGKLSVRLERNCYKKIKERLKSHLSKRNFDKATTEFNNLNGIPAWGGMIEDKKVLHSVMIEHIKKHTLMNKEQLKDFRKGLRINIKRTIFKVHQS